MRDRWQELVDPTDSLLHLGDVFFKAMPDWLPSLPGKIELVRGSEGRDALTRALRTEALDIVRRQ